MSVPCNSIRAFRRPALTAGAILTALAMAASGAWAAPVAAGPAALPAGLQTAVYATLANSAGSAYRIHRDGCASLPGHALTACFAAAGVRLSLPAAGAQAAPPLDLRLAAVGRGAALAGVSAVSPRIVGNRASYRYGNVTEWWRVLPTGVEQGFTIARRPAGHGELSLALAANRAPTARADGLAWGRLRYGGLVVTDAGGKTIPASLDAEGDRILVAVDDANARYPLTVDPVIWPTQELVGNDPQDNFFGLSVAIEGDTALVGAPQNPAGPCTQPPGAVYVFVSNSSGNWTQTQRLVPKDNTTGENFGWSVALDGTTALIGAQSLTCAGISPGAAYVFTEDANGTWSQAQKLTVPGEPTQSLFGHSVALNGTTALIGAEGETVNNNVYQGAAYVFTESNGTWTETQRLVAKDGQADDNFGGAVALAGASALIGSPTNSNGLGAVYWFVNQSKWGQVQKFTAAGSELFGSSIALSGTTALIGAPDTTVGGNSSQGAAYVFSSAGGSWQQVQELAASDGTAGDHFGRSVALGGAASVALIGAPDAAVGQNSGQGAAYLFSQSGGTWLQKYKLGAANGMNGDEFGTSVDFSSTTALVGAYGAAPGCIGCDHLGVAYIFIP